MTSILTNIASNTALQTLHLVNSRLQQTQDQVSSGLRVGKAADDVAYWSISTTMRSDAKAISAASDALGLGAAEISTAYEGTESIIDVLSEFKAKLVTAKEPSVDRSKIQQELSKLNEQAESIVRSSSFSGANWLSTDEPTHLSLVGELQSSVVTSFVRSQGEVSVQTADVDLRKTSMLNTGGGGILQADYAGELGDLGGLEGAVLYASAHNGHETHAFTGPATFSATDHVDFSVVVDALGSDPGVTYSGLRIDKSVVDSALGTTDGKIDTAAQMRTVLQKVFENSGVPLWTTPPAGYTSFTDPNSTSAFEFGSLETSGHNGSSVDIVGLTSDFGGAYPAGFALGLEQAPTFNHDNMLPKVTLAFTEAFAVTGTTEFHFDLQLGGGSVQTITVNQATVDAALGTSTGFVTSRDDFAAVLSYATAGTGVTATTSDMDYPGVVTFLADPALYPRAGNHALKFQISNVGNNLGAPPRTVKFDLARIDVTNSSHTVDQYLESVDNMLEKAVESAATLGALQQRVDMQADLNNSFMDSIDSGVSRLVDADMEESSARLAALQTQQQLAVQSLQISNSSPDNILQLFQ